MSEPTIEQLISHEYWEEQYPKEYTGRTPSLCVDIVEITLSAVLRELEAADEKDMHFIDDLKDRIRAAVGEKKS